MGLPSRFAREDIHDVFDTWSFQKLALLNTTRIEKRHDALPAGSPHWVAHAKHLDCDHIGHCPNCLGTQARDARRRSTSSQIRGPDRNLPRTTGWFPGQLYTVKKNHDCFFLVRSYTVQKHVCLVGATSEVIFRKYLFSRVGSSCWTFEAEFLWNTGKSQQFSWCSTETSTSIQTRWAKSVPRNSPVAEMATNYISVLDIELFVGADGA